MDQEQYLLGRAICIATGAHRAQVDKAGAPYILHPLHVMMAMKTIEGMIVGVLHDVVEDSDWTIEDLRLVGFSERVLEAIDTLTHRPGESYVDYIERIKHGPTLAQLVKLADLDHNMDLSRMPRPITDRDQRRWEKYRRAYAVLSEGAA